MGRAFIESHGISGNLDGVVLGGHFDQERVVVAVESAVAIGERHRGGRAASAGLERDLACKDICLGESGDSVIRCVTRVKVSRDFIAKAVIDFDLKMETFREAVDISQFQDLSGDFQWHAFFGEGQGFATGEHRGVLNRGPADVVRSQADRRGFSGSACFESKVHQRLDLGAIVGVGN